jgi:hypothetical protein
MLRSRSMSRIGRLASVVAGIAVVASVRLAHAQAGPPGSTPPPPPGGYPPPPPAYVPPPPYAPPPEPAGFHRSGFIIGVSLGAGSMGCSDCEDSDSLDGVALEIHLGGMVSPNVALMFDGSGVAHSFEGGGTLTHVVDTFAAQVWASDRLWFKGGIGIGQLSVSDGNSSSRLRSDTRIAGMLALGVELFQARSSALDLQLRGAATSFSDGTMTNGSILIGYSWY